MELIYLATFLVALLSSLLSGLAGGGGGFIMAPFWLLIGLSPAQGASSGALMATGMTASSLAAFRGTQHYPKDKKLIKILIIVTIVPSIIGALILPHIDVSLYKTALAIITILALPLLFIQPNHVRKIKHYQNFGLGLVIVLQMINSIITSSAFSILIALSLTTFFGMTILQMTALKRLIGVFQSVVLLTALLVQGIFVWQIALSATFGSVIGSYIGTSYAIKRGDRFAKYALAAASLVGAIALLFPI